MKASTILSWFNIIVWGFVAGILVLAALSVGNFAFLIFPFLIGFIILHSYASLQLLKSIKHPTIPLSRQTPVGIRFMGFVALFFGVLYIGDGIGLLQNTPDIAKMVEAQLPPQSRDLHLDLVKILRGGAIFCLVTGICIAVNVFLGFRLLRWYLFLRDNDIH